MLYLITLNLAPHPGTSPTMASIVEPHLMEHGTRCPKLRGGHSARPLALEDVDTQQPTGSTSLWCLEVEAQLGALPGVVVVVAGEEVELVLVLAGAGVVMARHPGQLFNR